MGLRQDGYAKVWSVKQKGKVCIANISVGKKNPQTGKYENSFMEYVNFGGKAAQKALELGLPEKTDKNNPKYRSIKITSSPDLTTYFDGEKYNRLISMANGNEELLNFIKGNATHLNITFWDFELAEDSNDKKNQAGQKIDNAIDEAADEDDLPF